MRKVDMLPSGISRWVITQLFVEIKLVGVPASRENIPRKRNLSERAAFCNFTLFITLLVCSSLKLL